MELMLHANFIGYGKDKDKGICVFFIMSKSIYVGFRCISIWNYICGYCCFCCHFFSGSSFYMFACTVSVATAAAVVATDNGSTMIDIHLFYVRMCAMLCESFIMIKRNLLSQFCRVRIVCQNKSYFVRWNKSESVTVSVSVLKWYLVMNISRR